MFLERKDGRNLDKRIKEHTVKADIAQERIRQLNGQTVETAADKSLLMEAVSTIRYETTVSNDALWVTGLMEAGVSPQLILKAWEAKDENSRRTRISYNQQQ